MRRRKYKGLFVKIGTNQARCQASRIDRLDPLIITVECAAGENVDFSNTYRAGKIFLGHKLQFSRHENIRDPL